jgi:dimethylamine/trimethylamine dehydrogenase
LCQDLLARQADWKDAGVEAVDCIGDCLAPGLIAHAVYAGHRYAREFEAQPGENHTSAEVSFRRRRWAPTA